MHQSKDEYRSEASSSANRRSTFCHLFSAPVRCCQAEHGDDGVLSFAGKLTGTFHTWVAMTALMEVRQLWRTKHSRYFARR
jgi:hypothetical protein